MCKFSCQVATTTQRLIGKGIPEGQFYHHLTPNQSTMNMSRDLAFQHVRGLTEPKIEEEISWLIRDRTAGNLDSSRLKNHISPHKRRPPEHPERKLSDRTESYSRRHSAQCNGDSTPHPPPSPTYARKGETRRKQKPRFVHKVPHRHRSERHRRNRRIKRRKRNYEQGHTLPRARSSPSSKRHDLCAHGSLSVFDRLSLDTVACGTLIHYNA